MIQAGDEVSVDFDKGEITANGKDYTIPAFPAFIQKIISAGGLLCSIQSRLLKETE
jgi:3-isopropylmalate dehydratase small subunit